MGDRFDSDAGGRSLQARVHDFVDRLGELAFAVWRDHRIAVIDAGSEPRRAFAEHEAQRRGFEVRAFCDIASAMAWLNAEH